MPYSIDTVFVWVTDLERSVEWYSALGVDSGHRYGDWQAMVVDGPSAFALHRGDRPEGPATGAIAFAVTDLDTEIARLSESGLEPVESDVTDTGVARFITYRDPDGNDVQLLQR